MPLVNSNCYQELGGKLPHEEEEGIIIDDVQSVDLVIEE